MVAKTSNRVITFPRLLTAVMAVCLVLTGCMGGGAGGGATSTSGASTPPATTSGTSNDSNNPDIIRRGDVLMIRLTGVPDTEGGVYEETVIDEGTISMPLLGSFKAAGKTLGQLKSDIEAAYRDRKIYSTPNVTVSQSQRFVNVLGEVRAPQRVLFTNDLTILKVVSACGGFTDYAQKREVKLLRGGKVYVFNAVDALKDPNKDVPLQAGDQIQVPRTIF